MTSEEFRQIALSLPEAVESSHMDHPDFRVKGKVFATLHDRDGKTGVVKLNPEQQRELLEQHPSFAEPVNGAWGKRGYTQIRLKRAKKAAVKRAILLAWRNTAPKRLVDEFTGGDDE